jgi:Ca2+:H+ antiporter
MNWLLLFAPVAMGLEVFAGDRHLLIFVTSSFALLPLAGWLGWATEQLAARMGEGVGGLLNATFGNSAELIIAIVALRAGLHDVVEASIAGSIVSSPLAASGFLNRPPHFPMANLVRPTR